MTNMASSAVLRELAVRAVGADSLTNTFNGASPDPRATAHGGQASSATRTEASGCRVRGAAAVEALGMNSLGERLGPRSETEEARPSALVTDEIVEGPPAWDEDTGSRLVPTAAAGGGRADGCSEQSVGSRAEQMLLGGGERPRATGWGRAVPEFNNGLIIELRCGVQKFWEARADDVRRACEAGMPMGYIDEMDVLAFVTVDALGQPLLHPDDANKFGKKVASKVARLEESLAKIDARVAAAVRRAREAAASNPSKLSRVAAAEESGRAERAALLEKPYDPQPPQSTIGAKRKERDGESWQQAAAATNALGRSIAAKQRAEEEVERRRRDVEHAGAAPERPSDDAALHVWRRYDRERAASTEAAVQLREAEARLDKKWQQVFNLGEEANELLDVSAERNWKYLEERGRKNAELLENNRAVSRKRRAELKRYFELSRVYSYTRNEEFEYKWGQFKRFINVVEASDGYGDVEFECAWMMVAGTGVGPPPPMEAPTFPMLPFEFSEHSPQWIETCRRKGVSPHTDPIEAADLPDVVNTAGLPHPLDYACWPSLDRPCRQSACRHCSVHQ